MFRDLVIKAVIPALDEQQTIASVVSGIDRELVDEVIVVDNGSKDDTARRARRAGARVVYAARRGYGSACLAGIAAAGRCDALVFLDGDGSDDPAEIALLLQALVESQAQLVIGSRRAADRTRRVLTFPQRAGNALACALIRRFWGVECSDLGPFRVLRTDVLDALAMSDPDMGWTVEMQVKAARMGLRVVEVDVSCHPRRGGSSKISGDLLGSVRAGRRILGTIGRARMSDLVQVRG